MPNVVVPYRKLRFASISSYGSITDRDINECINIIAKLFQEDRINKILIDATRQENTLGVVDLYNFSNKIPYNFKVALVVDINQPNLNSFKFLETTSYNKGKMLNLFTAEDEAKKWLFSTQN